MNNSDAETPPSAHVVIFPLPIQGPVNSMLKLAQLISIASEGEIHITFLTTEHVHRRLLLHGGSAVAGGWKGLTFHSFDDGLPENHPRGGPKFMEMLESVEEVGPLVLRELITTTRDGHVPPVTCVVADGSYGFALDVGNQVGVPVVYFETMSPSCLWVYLCLPKLFEDGKIPFQENEDMEELIGIPGMESILRRRDLPDFCRANNPFSNAVIPRVIKLAKQFKQAHGVILNTFDDLEPLVLSHISNYVRKTYFFGPLHFQIKERMQNLPSFYSNSLSHEDTNCIEWLDQQQPKSVLYCSFGSQVMVTKDQLLEFWHGLMNSGVKFLWVKRSGSVVGMNDDEDEDDVYVQVEEKGYVVNWAPQEEVLSHPSIGAFFTHSGWNSTMESIAAGIPMMCWPKYVDQLVISRYVDKVWKIGIDIKDTCDRVHVENVVRDLMQWRKDELLENVNRLAMLAKQSVDKGGSSNFSLDRLIHDIKSFQIPEQKSPM